MSFCFLLPYNAEHNGRCIVQTSPSIRSKSMWQIGEKVLRSIVWFSTARVLRYAPSPSRRTSACQTHCVMATLSRRPLVILYGLLLAKTFELSIKRRCRQNGRDPYDNQDRHGDSQANRRAPAIRLATRQRCAQMGVKPLWDCVIPADKWRHFELQQDKTCSLHLLLELILKCSS